MGVLTSGLLGIRPLKLKTSRSLDELAEAASEARYPEHANKPSKGWGSSDDDDEALGVPVVSRLTVGHPKHVSSEAVAAGVDDVIPDRLRLRYYWDRFDTRAHRTLGDSVAWDRLHMRAAVDVVIFDDETDDGRSVLVSARDDRLLRSEPFPAIRALGGDSASLKTEALNEELDPDLFLWLLWRLQSNPDLGSFIELASIREISSQDRLLRGARFTEQASLERIEMAALIAMGTMRFGPAKLNLDVADLNAAFDLELYLDGGFNVFRTSTYDDQVVAASQIGHKMAEEVWSIVLPRVRTAHSLDTEWKTKGRDELRSMAVDALLAIIPPTLKS